MSLRRVVVSVAFLTMTNSLGVAQGQEVVPTVLPSEIRGLQSIENLPEYCTHIDLMTLVCYAGQSVRVVSLSEHDQSQDVGSPDSGITYVPYNRMVSHGGPNGEACLTTGYFPLGVGDRREAFFWNEPSSIDALYPVCPVEPGSEGAPDTPLTYVARYWQLVQLPKPEP